MSSNNDIAVSGFSWALRHKREFSAVITIEDPDKHYGVRFHKSPHPEHLILKFVDLDSPLPAPYGLLSKNRLADKKDVQSAVDFARGRHKLLIHCEAGIGRSPGLCYVILCDRYGVGGEEQALRDLLIIQPCASPNMHIIALGDEILMRQGKMIEVVEKWYSATPNNLRRRELNRKAYLYA